MDATNDNTPKAGACPICRRPVDPALSPFCSKRCADIDLAKWFTGSYAIGGREEDEGDDPATKDPSQRPNGEDEED